MQRLDINDNKHAFIIYVYICKTYVYICKCIYTLCMHIYIYICMCVTPPLFVRGYFFFLSQSQCAYFFHERETAKERARARARADQTDRQIHRQKNRQTHRLKDIQTERQTDRQTNRQTIWTKLKMRISGLQTPSNNTILLYSPFFHPNSNFAFQFGRN